MAEQHPVQAFRAALETARLDLLERLAKSPSPLTESDLQLLAAIQMVCTPFERTGSWLR
jgi:hypothetical protein